MPFIFNTQELYIFVFKKEIVVSAKKIFFKGDRRILFEDARDRA